MIIEQPPTTAADLEDRSGPPRRSRWPWPVQLLVPVVGIAVAVVAAAAAGQGMLTLLGLGPTGPDPTGATALLLVLVPCLLVLAVAGALTALALRLDGGRRLADVTGRVGGRRHLEGLATGLGISFAVMVAGGLLVTVTGLNRPDPTAGAEGSLVIAAVIGLAQAFALQGIPEELLFRGYLLRSLRLRPWHAVVVSASVFGLIHLVSSGGQHGWGERILYLLPPFGFALVAGALVFSTGTVASAIGVHGGLHVALLASVLLAPRFPVLNIGDGPALWVCTGTGYVLVAVVIMVRGSRRGSRARAATVPAA